MFRGIAVGLLLAALAALPATAQDFYEGLAAADRGDYAAALKEWQPLAAKGHADAQYKMGFMYEEGRGVPLDLVQGTNWYRKAAKQGHAVAQRSLGLKYVHGTGVGRNYIFAHMLFNLSGASGDKFAREMLRDVARRMTKAQITDAQKLAQKWLKNPNKK
jgi:TPR repeat protein